MGANESKKAFKAALKKHRMENLPRLKSQVHGSETSTTRWQHSLKSADVATKKGSKEAEANSKCGGGAAGVERSSKDRRVKSLREVVTKKAAVAARSSTDFRSNNAASKAAPHKTSSVSPAPSRVPPKHLNRFGFKSSIAPLKSGDSTDSVNSILSDARSNSDLNLNRIADEDNGNFGDVVAKRDLDDKSDVLSSISQASSGVTSCLTAKLKAQTKQLPQPVRPNTFLRPVRQQGYASVNSNSRKSGDVRSLVGNATNKSSQNSIAVNPSSDSEVNSKPKTSAVRSLSDTETRPITGGSTKLLLQSGDPVITNRCTTAQVFGLRPLSSEFEKKSAQNSVIQDIVKEPISLTKYVDVSDAWLSQKKSSMRLKLDVKSTVSGGNQKLLQESKLKDPVDLSSGKDVVGKEKRDSLTYGAARQKIAPYNRSRFGFTSMKTSQAQSKATVKKSNSGVVQTRVAELEHTPKVVEKVASKPHEITKVAIHVPKKTMVRPTSLEKTPIIPLATEIIELSKPVYRKLQYTEGKKTSISCTSASAPSSQIKQTCGDVLILSSIEKKIESFPRDTQEGEITEEKYVSDEKLTEKSVVKSKSTTIEKSVKWNPTVVENSTKRNSLAIDKSAKVILQAIEKGPIASHIKIEPSLKEYSSTQISTNQKPLAIEKSVKANPTVAVKHSNMPNDSNKIIHVQKTTSKHVTTVISNKKQHSNNKMTVNDGTIDVSASKSLKPTIPLVKDNQPIVILASSPQSLKTVKQTHHTNDKITKTIAEIIDKGQNTIIHSEKQSEKEVSSNAKGEYIHSSDTTDARENKENIFKSESKCGSTAKDTKVAGNEPSTKTATQTLTKKVPGSTNVMTSSTESTTKSISSLGLSGKGTPTLSSGGKNEMDQDFFIEDEISDQPGLMIGDEVDLSYFEDDLFGEEISSPSHLATRDVRSRAESAGTISSIGGEDLILDYDTDDTRNSCRVENDLLSPIVAEVSLPDSLVKDGNLQQRCVSKEGLENILVNENAPVNTRQPISNGFPSSIIESTLPRASSEVAYQKQVDSVESDCIVLNRSTAQFIYQDVATMKSLLLRLHKILNAPEVTSPVNGETKASFYLNLGANDDTPMKNEMFSKDMMAQENMDLKRQMVLMQQQMEEKNKTIHVLKQQLSQALQLGRPLSSSQVSSTVTVNPGMTSSSCSDSSQSSNAATQTDRSSYKVCGGMGLSRTASVEDGLGPTVSSSGKSNERRSDQFRLQSEVNRTSNSIQRKNGPPEVLLT